LLFFAIVVAYIKNPIQPFNSRIAEERALCHEVHVRHGVFVERQLGKTWWSVISSFSNTCAGRTSPAAPRRPHPFHEQSNIPL
jgi:hypothetical protein